MVAPTTVRPPLGAKRRGLHGTAPLRGWGVDRLEAGSPLAAVRDPAYGGPPDDTAGDAEGWPLL